MKKENIIDMYSIYMLRGQNQNCRDTIADLIIKEIDQLENINMPGRDGRTLLHHCCIYNYNNFARILIKKMNADVNVQDDKGFSPLQFAAYADNAELVQLLLENGAQVNQLNKYGNNASFYAHDKWDILKLLIDYRCDIYHKNIGKVSAYAIISRNPDVLEKLKQYFESTPKPAT